MATQKYVPPLDPVLARKFDALDVVAQEFYQERAAIREFDGQQSRQEAEAAAWEETLRYLERRNAGDATP